MVAILPAGPLQKCRAADTAAEVESYTRDILSLRQFAGYVSIRPDISRFSGSSVRADCLCFLSAPDLWSMLPCAFYFAGCGLHLPSGICCRVTVNLHQNPRSFEHCTRPVRHFRCVKRQSDAQPPHHAIPLFSGLWRSFPDLTRLFRALSARKRRKRSIPRGQDAPENSCPRRQPVQRTG